MANLTIIRGDSYALRRPLYTYTIVDENSAPFPLEGCTIRTTYKPISISLDVDPDDQTAIIRHEIVIGEDGVPSVTNGLHLQGSSAAGIVVDRMSSTETKAFLPEIVYLSDLQLTDALGEVFTWIWVDGVLAIDAITNRDA